MINELSLSLSPSLFGFFVDANDTKLREILALQSSGSRVSRPM